MTEKVEGVSDFFLIYTGNNIEFELDPEFQKRFREWCSRARRPDVWEMLSNNEDISDL